jgi:undecaprenyl-diphosphatase
MGWTIQLDDGVRGAVHSQATEQLTAVAELFSFCGSLKVVIPLSVLFAIWLLYRREDRAAAGFALIMAGSLGLNWGLKNIFERPRPEPFYAVDPETFSFPSGHVLFSACFLGGLWLILKWRIDFHRAGICIIVTFITLVGWSRVYLGVHYPTDVIGGGLVALSWLKIAGSFLHPTANTQKWL